MERARPAATSPAPRRGPPTGLGQGSRPRTAQQSLPARHLARGQQHQIGVPLRCRTRPPGAGRHPPQRTERPEGEADPTKYWFPTLPADTSLTALVRHAKRRWRIERDYQDLKQELGLGDYEGRGWRGFHHHATLCIAAYGFLIAERGAIPPSAPHFSAPLSGSAIPDGYRPRGAT